MILAAIAGGLAGVAVLLRLYWNRFLGLFSARRRQAAEEARSELLGRPDTPEETQSR